MKALLQRVTEGSVTIDGEVAGSIGKGLVILFGAGQGDTEKDAQYLAEKCVNLRIFHDEEGKMNRSLLDVDGEVLIISQFTLYADIRKGRRPSFTGAALPDYAKKIYEEFIKYIKEVTGLKVETGEFGADMKVSILNDGPVTIILDSKELA